MAVHHRKRQSVERFHIQQSAAHGRIHYPYQSLLSGTLDIDWYLVIWYELVEICARSPRLPLPTDNRRARANKFRSENGIKLLTPSMKRNAISVLFTCKNGTNIPTAFMKTFAFLSDFERHCNSSYGKRFMSEISNKRRLQLFRERLSEKQCTRQSRKVIWDMINTLVRDTLAVEPLFVAFL